MGVGTNFGVGGRRGEDRRAESGDGVIGEGTASPSPPTIYRGFAGALSFLSGVRGGAPATEGFSGILSRQIAFPSISVRGFYRGIYISISPPHK